MAAHAGFKGQLGLRSSALAPTSSKLTTQYLVLDHMNNHYKKIVNAKPAIDNGRPKSINKSQKIRDRKTRNYVEKTGSRPHSSMNVRPSHDYYDDQNLYGEDLDGYDVEDEDDQLVLDIMRTTLRANSHPHGGSADATYGSESDAYHKHHLEPQHRHAVGRHYQQRPASARSLRSAGSATSRTALLKGPPKAGTYDGDLLDKRSQVFTEPEKPFTPRILKSTRSSKLSQNKYYTPPPQKRKENDTARESHANEGVNAENKTKPKPKPRHTSPHARPDSTMSENTLMYETLHTRDFSKFDTNHEQKVPPLDISMDKDHMNWIKEQASKAQIRAKSATLKSTMSQIHEDDYLDSTGGLGETGDMTLGKTNRNFGTKTMRNQTMMGQDSMYQGKSPRLTQAEEELKYVEFTKEVTDDVLNRGIFTNRVLKQVFRTHLQKNRGILNESKMRAVLDKIRLDLDIPDTDNYNDLEYTGDHSFDNATTMSGTFQSASLYNTGMSKFGNRTLDDTIDSQNTFGLTSNAGDLYSTINTNMGTLTDTQALKSYQLNISKKMALDGEHVDDEHLEGSGKFEVTMKTDDTQSNVSAASMTKAGKERAAPQASRPRQVLVKSSISDKEAALDGDGDASEGEIVEGSTLVRRSSTQAGSRDHMSDVGSVKGSVKGSIKGSVVGSVKGSVKSLPSHHSERGALLDDEEGENNTIYASTGGNDDEDGAYGEDEFEESEDEKTQGATHRTSDDDF